MIKKEEEKKYTVMISEGFDHSGQDVTYEVPFRRWLVRELAEQRMSISQAIDRFNFNPSTGASLICKWQRKYGSDMVLALPSMTQEEREKLEVLQKRIKELEDQLEQSRMKNIALDTLIDVAEQSLKISIRKKRGAKQ
jgi:hypothetical protein